MRCSCNGSGNRNVRCASWRTVSPLVMRKYPNLTAEAAFSRTLEHYGIELTDEEFVEKMYAVRRVIYGAMHYTGTV